MLDALGSFAGSDQCLPVEALRKVKPGTDQRVGIGPNHSQQATAFGLEQDANGADDGQAALFGEPTPRPLVQNHCRPTQFECQGNCLDLSRPKCGPEDSGTDAPSQRSYDEPRRGHYRRRDLPGHRGRHHHGGEEVSQQRQPVDLRKRD